jgi:tetratricopeptide (TPR) repeat protein
MEPGAARAVEAIPATLADSLMARLDRLATAKEVAQRAAVLGREFSYPLLAAVAGLEAAALRQGLTKLVEAEIVFVRGKPPQATYTFKHALVQEAAYGSLLKRTRQQLHARVAQALEAQFPEPAAGELGIVARHYEAAGLQDQAVAYYQQAGEQAAARSAHEEAVAHLRRAITVLNRLPERDHDGREAGLQRALAPSLTAVRGYAHPETEATYERARVLYSAAGDRENSSWALHGLANVCLNLAKFQRALDLIEQALEVTETAQGDVYIAAAHAQKSTIYYYQGRFGAALEHAETATRLYGPAGHYRPGVFSPFGADESVGSQSSSAWTLWQLGYPDQALARARESIEFATMLDHPFSIAHARFFEVVVQWMRRDVVAQRQTAEELIRFASAQRFPLFVGVATTFRGHALGNPAGIIDGLTRAAGTGTQCGAPMIFTVLAEAYQGCGNLTEALGAVETGLAIAAQTGQPFFDAELHRLQGEITLKIVDSPQPRVESQKTAEECFHRALDIARAQEAKSIELRAATSLARLWQRQGKRDAARDLLAPVYAWFTEGFDTRDLQDAKALLEELSR